MTKRHILLLIVAAVLAALIVLRLMLPELVRDYLNDRLANLNNYTGHVENVDIHLWRGAYRLDGLEVVRVGHEIPVPFISIDALDFSVSWRALWKGAVVAEAHMHAPVLNFVDAGEYVDQVGEGTDWQDALQQLAPIRIDHIAVSDGRVHFRNFISDPPVNLEVSDITASVINLTNADRSQDPQYATVEARGRVLNQAVAELEASLDPLGDLHDFSIRLRVRDIDLTRLNTLTRAYANFDFQSGTGGVVMELEAENARLTGYVRPLLDDVEIFDFEEAVQEGGLLGAVWEGLVAGLSRLFRNHPEDRLAAQIEIRGDLDQQEISGWQAFVSVLRNAFVEAYEDAFGRE